MLGITRTFKTTSKDSDSAYHKYLRKLNSYLLIPSVDSVDKRLRNFECYRLFDLSDIGLGWVYAFKNRDRNYVGWFILTNPEDYFTVYDSAAIPEDDNGLAEALNAIRPVQTKVKRALRIVENAKSIATRAN